MAATFLIKKNDSLECKSPALSKKKKDCNELSLTPKDDASRWREVGSKPHTVREMQVKLMGPTLCCVVGSTGVQTTAGTASKTYYVTTRENNQ